MDLDFTVQSLGLSFLLVIVVFNTVIAIGAFRADSKNMTNKVFSALTIAITLWLIVMYLTQVFILTEHYLWSARMTLFTAIFMNSGFLLFAYTIPHTQLKFKRKYIFWLLILIVGLSVITLSSLGFKGVELTDGGIPKMINGSLFFLYGLLNVAAIVGGLYILIKKFLNATGIERQRLLLVLTGLGIMLVLTAVTIFFPVLLFGNIYFVQFAPLYTFAFTALTAYAIIKHGAFNVKVVLTYAFVFILWAILFSRINLFGSLLGQWLDILIFSLSIIFGALLSRSVSMEIKQRNRAQHLAEGLSDSISFATHELRGPISNFRNILSLIFEGDYGKMSHDLKEALVDVFIEVEDMSLTVDTFLNFNRLQIDQLVIEPSEVDISALIKRVIIQQKYLTERNKIHVTFQELNIVQSFVCDRFKIQHVINNILSNAIKYNTSGGTVRINLSEKNNQAIVTMIDSGIGMDKETLQGFFEGYQRSKSRDIEEIEGHGIGMWLSKKIVELHKGRIWVESDGLKKGSTIGFAIPMEKEIEQ